MLAIGDMDTKREDFEKVLVSLREAFENYKNGLLEKNSQITPDFNAFCTLYALELPLSRMIGELLNPNGTHAQRSIFLDLFIELFLKNSCFPKKIKKVNLELEHQISSGGRIDILVDFDKKFGIAIENKPYAAEQKTQIKRYSEYMSEQYGEMNYLILYLSRDGSLPSEYSLPKQDREKLGDKFIPLSYRQIGHWCNKCAVEANKSSATRLSTLIEEFSEYINREFYGVNTLKNKMLGETIEKNILEAFEINLLWQKNHEAYDTQWRNTINRLFNEKLPELVFESLKKEGAINENWEWIKGKFDINILHLEGFRVKKKNWKHFEIGVISDRFKLEKGKRNFFPAILSKEKIQREDYIDYYNKVTGCNPIENPFLKLPPTQWYAEFPDTQYRTWGYEQWTGIKPDGSTVKYVANFLKKLIKACAIDIDKEEKRLQNL